MKTHKLSLPLASTPQSLKDMVSFLGTSPEEISKTSLVCLENNLFFYYDATPSRRRLTCRISKGSGVNMACAELATDVTYGHIHYCLAMYNLAIKCLNCQIQLSLARKKLTILITPLDENSAEMLNSMVKKEPPADEF